MKREMSPFLIMFLIDLFPAFRLQRTFKDKKGSSLSKSFFLRKSNLVLSWIIHEQYPFVNTAIFIMVVIPAVLAHDVSARAGDVSMEIAIFPIG